jgi:hypothetical protein
MYTEESRQNVLKNVIALMERTEIEMKDDQPTPQ